MSGEQQNRKSKIAPLTLQFFEVLTKLEEGFHIKVLDKSKINTLIQKYAQLVEYYDFYKDPIKNYFLDKIQFVLSRPDTIKSMVQQDTIQEENEQESYNHFQVPKQMTVSRAPSIAEQIDRKNVLKGLELNENHQKSRGQQMNLTLQIQMLKKEQEPSLDKLMNDYKSETEKMDQYIQSEMKIQTDAVQLKLEQRKKKLVNQQNKLFRTEASDDESTPQLQPFE
ncbi:unnamed protein product (macronuclear) [Paramecium tetraurelia]|uniref:Uncharacterized protein n=1 Tax=Paramecium tetraurelia TaxID=5888 RepID=A0D2L8_PARTE|nr:uncharacterized protein GSPATT00012793001 [Paramecium tetraurelia]CAK77285.1 unnamed protein product [Paramecium tetraurelia]|eukprot:XP_001444682.1 hypothetical protein (macronuclear) [Paramecium tetraurelia strain d4-2]